MPGFSAQQVEPLDYDFTGWGVDAKGTIPEPTQAQLNQFLDRIRELFGSTDEAQIDARIQAMDADEVKQMGERTIDVIAEFCQGRPSREEIAALPVRPQQSFFGWLVGQFSVGPTTHDMNGSRATPTSV